ncbi:hypothetical protein DWZ56_02715 [Lachnotalea sp. AF33-28]|nr:hypothetical protein DWZ56_02715 [Lachnotalea sp. AF33-28]
MAFSARSSAFSPAASAAFSAFSATVCAASSAFFAAVSARSSAFFAALLAPSFTASFASSAKSSKSSSKSSKSSFISSLKRLDFKKYVIPAVAAAAPAINATSLPIFFAMLLSPSTIGLLVMVSLYSILLFCLL